MSTRNMNTNTKRLGTAIRKARKEVGLSQKEFADQLHVSDKTVSSYEVGRATPGFETLKKMSRLMNKPLAYFDVDNSGTEDLDLQIKLSTIERELLEIRKLLQKRDKKG